jgi:hypothetical protein
MPKFEYCICNIAYVKNKIIIAYPNGDSVDASDKSILDVFNDLGKERWELVSVNIIMPAVAEVSPAGSFYFKREI